MRRIWKVLDALNEWLFAVPCPECGEESYPSEFEYESVGTGVKASRCPKCEAIIV